MKLTRLPISVGYALCPKCRLPTELSVFESGPGGDFATYLGGKTGTTYRLDLGKIYYQGLTLAELLAPVLLEEGNLIQIPHDSTCKLCGSTLKGTSIAIEREIEIEAREL